MGLETMSFVSDFNTAWPLGSDLEKQGDDHIRGVKAAIKATFLDTFTAGVFLPKITSAANALVVATLKNLSAELGMINGELVASVAGNALTIAIKTLAGTDPSPTDPVYLITRSPTAATGTYIVLPYGTSVSLVISSGSTMGATNSIPFRLWIVGFNDGSTFRLGAINCRSGVNISALRDDILQSSTAEGGAGGADSAQVIYTGTAVAAKAMRILGYLEWSAGLAAVGTWGIVPTKIQLCGAGVPKPGDVIQSVGNDVSASSTGTTTIPADNTIPQNTEGDQFLSQAITPMSAANLLEIEIDAFFAVNVVVNFTSALFQDATANALRAKAILVDTINGLVPVNMLHKMLSGTVSSTTFKLRCGGGGAGTWRINGTAGAQLFNGVGISSIYVKEIMG